MHESLDEYKFPPDTATNSRVNCPCVSEKLMYNVVNTLAPLFLIGSSSFLQVNIKSQPSSKFDQIGPWTAELAALGRLEKSPYTYNGRNLVNTLAAFIFNGIFFILARNKDMHESLDEFEFRQICNRVTALD